MDLSAHNREWRAIAVGATLIATVAIVMTYPVLSNMYDEPAHLAAGMEWLDRGTFTLEPQHPPLSRVASAILPWLDGARSTGNTHMFSEGRAILGRGEHYWRVLTLARLGQLPFFFTLAFVVWFWARRLSDERTAAIAVAFVATNPNILAHSAVAGTDIGPAALMPAALLTWTLWIHSPTLKRSMVAGGALALCGLTKFSAGAYWLPAALLVALAHAATRPDQMPFFAGARRLFRPFLVFAASGALTTWAAYRFSVGRVDGLLLPAPELWIGLRDFLRHGTGGHPTYLFGEVRMAGWWYYDIVALLVKTPIPLLLLGLAGDALSVKHLRSLGRAGIGGHANGSALLRIALHAGVIAVIVVASAAPVDLGVRLDLAIYAMMSVLAAMAVTRAIESRTRWARGVVAALCAWAVIIPAMSHPDHVAYFNPFAGSDPGKVLVDSNLDWGQDLERLRIAEQELQMDSLRVHYFGTAEFAAIGLKRARRLRPNERATGWVAASETFYRGVWADSALNWLHSYEPVARVGKSIRLYYIGPSR